MMQHTLRSKSTFRFWFTLSGCAVSASVALIIHHSIDRAAASEQHLQQPPAQAQTANTFGTQVETPILIGCASRQGDQGNFWMVGSHIAIPMPAERLGLKGILPVWSAKRTGVLAVASKTATLMYCAYDAARHSFGPLERVDLRFANAGVKYKLNIGSAFAWSPDGSRIVYTEDKKIVTFDLHTGHRRVLADNAKLALDRPDWSPDGSTIAFDANGSDPIDPAKGPGSETFRDIWLMNADGSQLRRLGHGMNAHWSGDGRALLVCQGSESGAGEVGSYDLTTQNRYRTLRPCTRVSPEGKLYSYQGIETAAYSADGQYIVVVGAYDPGSEAEGVFLMDRQGRIVQLLAHSSQRPGAIRRSSSL